MGVVYLLLLTNAILLTSCVFGSCTVLTDMGVTLSTMSQLDHWSRGLPPCQAGTKRLAFMTPMAHKHKYSLTI